MKKIVEQERYFSRNRGGDMIPWDKQIFALYQGDNFIAEGTILEISKKTNKALSFLRWMKTPSYSNIRGDSKRCLRLILLDDED
ncbi:hypothetical protein QCI77_27920 [Bacillus cereus group sp. MG9]|uniref:hypothetical protein n=1 Tax=Bacillus cereus group sp. MG9 TaxID=3040247 RepID=UPI0033918F3A